jgi:hypothetical protein
LDVQNLKQDGTNIANWGSFDLNYYCRPLNETKTIYTGAGSGKLYSLSEWQALYGHDRNSKISPKTFPSNINPDDPKSVKRSKALSVLQEHCISCHFGRHTNWSGFTTDSQWVTANLIIPGDSANSRLILKLQNRGGNMPLNNPPISEDEVDILTDWIDQM